jgi:hypothetical protein
MVIRGQTTGATNNLWVSGGPGFFRNGPYAGLSFYGSLSWYRSNRVNTLNGVKSRNLFLKARGMLNFSGLDEDNYENFREYGVLYGKSFGKVGQFSISAGIGIVEGLKTAGYNPPGTPRYGEKRFAGLGLPLECELNFVPAKVFGIGIIGFADINPKVTYYGFTINLLLGKIR